MITAQELRDARHRADLTQAELAARMGVSLRTVTNWEGASGPLADRAEQKIMSALGGTITRMRQGVAGPEILDIPAEVLTQMAEAKAALEPRPGGLTAAERDSLRDRSLSERGYGGEQRKRRLLSMFTDIDLLHELTNRARQRYVYPSDWATRALENDPMRLNLIQQVAEDFNNISGNVPGSADTQDDFGLVANDTINEFPEGNDADYDQA